MSGAASSGREFYASNRCIAGAVLLVALISSLAAAQEIVPSIEFLVDDSQAVVRARVVRAINWLEPSPPTMVLKIDEAIKGNISGEIKVRLSPSLAKAQRPDDGEEVLTFIDPVSETSRPFTDAAWELNAHPIIDRLSAPDLTAYSMDKRRLGDREEILRVARHAATLPRRNNAYVVGVEIPGNAKTPSISLIAPVNVELERLAQGWAAEGDQFNAFQALRFFRSEKNAELIRPMLRSSVWFTSINFGRLAQVKYYLRDEVDQLLNDWGIPHERPSIVEPNDCYRSIRWYWVFALAMMGVGILAVSNHPRIIRITRLRPPTLLAALGAALAAILWISSYVAASDLYWDAARCQVWLSSCKGSLQIAWVSNWPGTHKIDFAAASHGASYDMDARFSKGPAMEARGLLVGWFPFQQHQELLGLSPWNFRNNQHHFMGLSFVQDLTSYVPAGVYVNRVQIHLAWFVGLLGGWAIFAMVRQARLTRRRIKLGLCLDCGYDLRATPGRCPECGAMALSKVSPQTGSVQ